MVATCTRSVWSIWLGWVKEKCFLFVVEFCIIELVYSEQCHVLPSLPVKNQCRTVIDIDLFLLNPLYVALLPILSYGAIWLRFICCSHYVQQSVIWLLISFETESFSVAPVQHWRIKSSFMFLSFCQLVFRHGRRRPLSIIDCVFTHYHHHHLLNVLIEF